MPETGVHLELRTALYLTVRHLVGERGAVGSEQFVYWDPGDPRQCLAPDLVVRLGAKPGPFRYWKTWEGGAPRLGVEIVSRSDTRELAWGVKLKRYARAGVAEVVRFDPERPARPLRIWDLVDGDLVERELVGSPAFLCDTLGLYWVARPHSELGLELRLAEDAEGEKLVPSPDEIVARVAELEAELRRRG